MSCDNDSNNDKVGYSDLNDDGDEYDNERRMIIMIIQLWWEE